MYANCCTEDKMCTTFSLFLFFYSTEQFYTVTTQSLSGLTNTTKHAAIKCLFLHFRSVQILVCFETSITPQNIWMQFNTELLRWQNRLNQKEKKMTWKRSKKNKRKNTYESECCSAVYALQEVALHGAAESDMFCWHCDPFCQWVK